MKHFIRYIAAALTLLFSGCPSVTQAPGPAMHEVAGGAIEHSASGMQFPAVCGEFTRVGTRQYDAGGLDVSVGYNLSSPISPIAITVYVYPSPPVRSFGSPEAVVMGARSTLARSEFQRAKNEIVQPRPGAKVLSEESVAAPGQALSPSGFLARFHYSESFAGQVRPVESLLYVYCYVGEVWTIKYRITYPAGLNTRPAIDHFIQNFHWTARKPNKAPEPTPGSVTGRADARPAPAPVVAHL